jgi:hypothetical protein
MAINFDGKDDQLEELSEKIKGAQRKTGAEEVRKFLRMGPGEGEKHVRLPGDDKAIIREVTPSPDRFHISVRDKDMRPLDSLVVGEGKICEPEEVFPILKELNGDRLEKRFALDSLKKDPFDPNNILNLNFRS